MASPDHNHRRDERLREVWKVETAMVPAPRGVSAAGLGIRLGLLRRRGATQASLILPTPFTFNAVVVAFPRGLIWSQAETFRILIRTTFRMLVRRVLDLELERDRSRRMRNHRICKRLERNQWF